MSYLFYIYFAFVFALTVSHNVITFSCVLVLGLVVLLLGSRELKKHCRVVELKIKPTSSDTSHLRLFTICFSVVLVGSIIYWLGFYPGGFNLDAYGQWDQAHGVIGYNDWHPLTSTLLIQLSVMIWDSFAFCIFVQIVAFSFSIALLLSTLNHHGVSRRIILVMAAYTALNPAIALNTISLTKDVQFTILAVLLVDILLRIYFSEGKWLSGAWRCLYFALVSALLCLVRHNGILYAAPALLLLIFLNRSITRQVFYTAVLAALCVMAVKVPISTLLNVSPHDDPIGEVVGIPMAIMANALVSDPESIPEEVHDFLNEIADDADWNEYYYLGEWDSCKWIFSGATLIKETSPATLLKCTLLTIESCPEAAYESFRENTQIVWQPVISKHYWTPEVYIENNEYNIKQKPIGLFSNVAAILIGLSRFFPLSIFCWNTGFQIILIMLALLFARGKRYNTAAFLYLPLLVYDMGTMLLLAGPNQRYFYCNAVLFFPLTVSLLLERGDVCRNES